MSRSPWIFADIGEAGLLVGCAPTISQPLWPLRTLAGQLRAAQLPGVWDYVPAGSTLLVYWDPLQTTRAAIIAAVQRHNAGGMDGALPGRIVPIAVDYGGPAGPDLLDVALATGLLPSEVIDLHTGQPFPVEMIGFMPGFPYLHGLPAVLHLPRRSNPRVSVPGGSVAIANGRSGIYPATAPGGWHIIGHTEARLFDPHREPPALLAPGDYVQFIASSTAGL